MRFHHGVASPADSVSWNLAGSAREAVAEGVPDPNPTGAAKPSAGAIPPCPELEIRMIPRMSAPRMRESVMMVEERVANENFAQNIKNMPGVQMTRVTSAPRRDVWIEKRRNRTPG